MSVTETSTRRIENAPMTRTIWLVAVFTIGGMFVDGYILGHTGIALAIATPELGLDALWLGLLGASTLVGILVGAPIIGRLADRFGRRTLLAWDFAFLTVASAAHLLVTDQTQLVVLRFLIGIAIGAEYAVGAALLSELAPARRRGALLASLNAGWIVGFVVAFLVAFGMREAGAGWQAVLATAAVPALIVFLLRIGSPESPRWLVAHGRLDEAQATVDRCFGPGYGLDGLAPDATVKAGFGQLFSSRYWRRSLFAGLFWACQVVPLFALTIFLPQVFEALSISSELGAEMLVNSMLLVGAAAGVAGVRYLSRRGFTTWSFVVVGVALVVMAFAGVLPTWVALVAFAAFVLIGSAASDLEYVYPSEIFPTELRATGLGFAAAVSRVGAATSTFLLPIALEGLGSMWTMLLLAAVALIGAAFTIAWAPETRGLSLEAAAGREAH